VLRARRPIPRRLRHPVTAAGAPAAGASGIAAAAAFPPCVLSAAGRLPAAFARPAACRGGIAGLGFLAALVRAARLRPGLAAADFAAAAGVAFSGAPDFPAALALALLATTHRLFVAAMIGDRPSGLGRRFFLAGFAGAGVAGAAASAFRTAAQRFLCAAAMRRRAAGLTTRLGASSSANVTVLSKPCDPVMRTRTPERVRGDPGFVRRSGVLGGDLDGGLDARHAGSGEALAVEDGQWLRGVRAAC
jgi:hypothetical protein